LAAAGASEQLAPAAITPNPATNPTSCTVLVTSERQCAPDARRSCRRPPCATGASTSRSATCAGAASSRGRDDKAAPGDAVCRSSPPTPTSCSTLRLRPDELQHCGAPRAIRSRFYRRLVEATRDLDEGDAITWAGTRSPLLGLSVFSSAHDNAAQRPRAGRPGVEIVVVEIDFGCRPVFGDGSRFGRAPLWDELGF